MKKLLIFLLIFSFIYIKVNASHIVGGELFYSWVSGNTYKVTLVLYGDCKGSSFPQLPSSVPEIKIYNGASTTASYTLNLTMQNPTSGVEVTPVCNAQASQTTCNNTFNVIPGIKKFVASSNITISGLSTNWRFVFDGVLGGSSSAGRSNIINNITNGTIIHLEATLNSTVNVQNSSAIYTVIPTPFFCINKAANYNPGAVDPNGDSLYVSLTPGVDATSGTNVNYLVPYTYLNPLDVVGGSQSFNTTNGQFSFTPSVVNVYLVVYKVSEYKNGVLVGTSMREMNFYIRNCSNNPPSGTVSNPSGGVNTTSNSTVSVCNSIGLMNFSINPTDPDGDTIDVSVTGLPAGATFPITNNGTPTPMGTFNWNVSAVAAGNYTFFITYQDRGCPLSSKQTIAYTITVLPNPRFNYNLVSAATCLKKAVFTITPSLGSPYVINVNQGSTTLHTFNLTSGSQTDSLSPGTYTISITSTNGCTYDSTIIIASPSTMTVTKNVVAPTCNQYADGSLTLTVLNGNPPYTYKLGTGSYGSSNVFSGLTAGIYSFTVKDDNGCTISDTALIPVTPKIKDSIVISNLTCFNNSTGSIIIYPYNSTAPYTFALNSGAYGSSNTFTGLSAGSYAIHIKNSAGCLLDTSVTISQPTLLTLAKTQTNVTCNGFNDGKIVLIANGGTLGYKFSKDGITYQSSNIFNLLPPATYTFYVKDTNGCITTIAATITEPAILKMGMTPTNPNCNGTADGKIVLTATGGTTLYNFAINTGTFGANGTFNGLIAGTYNLHLKDANGCLVDSTVTLIEPSAITPAAAIKRPRCTPLVNGAVTLNATGGVPVYTYAVGSGLYTLTNLFNGLPSGAYVFHIKDSHNCIKDTTLTITDSIHMITPVTITNVTCNNFSNGSILVAPAGGDPTYTFSIGSTAYSTTNPITNLVANTYVLHVKDANGCINDTNVTVTQPSILIPTISFVQPLCNGGNNGSITAGSSGGTPSYTYALNTGLFSSTTLFSNISAGSQIIHIKDANGCLHDTSFTVTQPLPILFSSLITTQVKCFGDSSGTAIITAINGTPPYLYAADANAYTTNSLITNLKVGSHIIHIKDANGCIADSTITLTQPKPLYFDSAVLKHPTCENFTDGSIILYGTGGTPWKWGYQYSIDNFTYSTDSLFKQLIEGTYTLYVKDSNACIHDTTVTLIGYPHININTIAITNENCYADTNAVMNLIVSGGVQPLTYTIKNPLQTNNSGFFNHLPIGNYSIKITDSKGCIKDSSATITQPDSLKLATLMIGNDCTGLDDGGSIKLYVLGGTPPYSYIWNTNPTQLTDSVFGLANGTYLVQVTDAHECLDTMSTLVTYADCCKPFIPTAFTPNGDGKNDIFKMQWKGDVSKLDLYIYNRFGQRVFNSHDALLGWDGYFGGKLADVGTYFYIVSFDCGNKGDNHVNYKGDFELIR